MSLRLATRLLTALAPAVLLLPTAAHAEQLTTDDAVADVVTVGPTEEGQGDLANLVPTPDNLTADVVRTVVDHAQRRLRVRVDLRELGRDKQHFAVLSVRTPTGTFEVEADDLGHRPKADMTRRGRSVECPRLRAVGDRASSRVTVTIPASCLGGPRWVRVGVGVAVLTTATNAEGVEEVAVLADDAQRAGDVRDRIALGPKVHRG
ncbi:hypothetical protein ASG76_14715 [Nocardioides sp. Soil774]|uniref:hypothetical protein n=1 Tax=Nocardioides sp. Soil774 TaxID=1736408 RepID=UPI0006FB5B1D|nr:hypothetical protein [Nocardioides sp. Soil774]KRE93680.1 hypothetical protein ASG76_14715 [Nocardioides sp. Soil774]